MKKYRISDSMWIEDPDGGWVKWEDVKVWVRTTIAKLIGKNKTEVRKMAKQRVMDMSPGTRFLVGQVPCLKVGGFGLIGHVSLVTGVINHVVLLPEDRFELIPLLDTAKDIADRVGDKWTEEEEEQLLKEFDMAVQLMQLLHKRNCGGIRARLTQLARENRL